MFSMVIKMNSNNCSQNFSNPIITFKDRGNSQQLTIHNPNSYAVIKTRVDGCEIVKGLRCDFMMEIVESNYDGIREYYIELKGTDLTKALEQILATEKILARQRGCLKKGFIICNRSPESSTENQRLKFRARAQNIDLTIKSKKLDYKI
mgnify:CR=1 FL=1